MINKGNMRMSAAGKYEALNARLFVAMLVVVLALSAVIVGLTLALQSKQESITFLQTNRLMYAYPNEDGVYVSSEKRPTSVVRRVAQSVVYNLYNYDRYSAAENFKAATKEINPQFAVRFADKQSKKAEEISRQSISSLFTIQREFELQETKQGYVYEIAGIHEVYASRTFVEAHALRIQVNLKKVVPTEARPLGLWVESIKEVSKSKVR